MWNIENIDISMYYFAICVNLLRNEYEGENECILAETGLKLDYHNSLEAT